MNYLDLESLNFLIKKVKNLSNPNLFINSNFRINQRGITTYTTNKAEEGKYVVDRWKGVRDYNDSGLEFSLQDDGLQAKFIHASGSWGKIVYKMDEILSKSLSNQTITISSKVKLNQVMLKEYCIYNYDSTTKTQLFGYPINTSTNGIYAYTCTLPEITGNLIFEFRFSGVENSTIVFEHVKLELGDMATIYVAPDPIQELIKCKGYYQEISGIFIPYSYRTDTIHTNIKFNDMIQQPKLSFKSNIFNQVPGTTLINPEGIAYTGFAITLGTGNNVNLNNNFSVRCEKANHGLNNDNSSLLIDKLNPVCLDAEL